MHDIWNPWHGCVKKSEGCDNCYMYYLDARRGKRGSDIYRTSSGFSYPLSRERNGEYRIKSGEMLRVCMASDFFLREADPWRDEAWEIIRKRSDVIFFLLTKRPERAAECLPDDWGEGWDNVFFNVTAENQKRADERIPVLLSLPLRHRGVMCAPLIGPVDIGRYLDGGLIEQVLCDGENYQGSRPCSYEWVASLSAQCRERNVSFVFCGTGRRFLKDGKMYSIEDSRLQNVQAHLSGLSYQGKRPEYILRDETGQAIPKERLYVPSFRERCESCGMRPACNGCENCGRCRT